MYTQFFGNYLLNNGYITSEQLIKALDIHRNHFVKLGVLAIHGGYMTSSQVEDVHITQTHTSQKFGEIAVAKGYLTDEQVDELLKSQKPDYLSFSQTLSDLGYINATDFEKAFKDYQAKYHLCDNDFASLKNEKLIELVRSYYNISEDNISYCYAQYIVLLFNNIIRFIGKDFTPHPLEKLEKLPDGHMAFQEIKGEFSTISLYIADAKTTLKFASRYAQEDFPEKDEYVEASVEDFLNLHNGLFITTMSNDLSIELYLEPPYTNKQFEMKPDKYYYSLPVTFSFGTVYFITERSA